VWIVKDPIANGYKSTVELFTKPIDFLKNSHRNTETEKENLCR